MIVKWPGVVDGGSICSEPVISTDFFPTMLEMARIGQRPNLHQDGLSLVPLLKDDGALDRNALYWHFPHYHGSGNRPSGAVRAGDYKLVEWFEDGQVELYNLAEDIGESLDLSEAMPEKAAELTEMLHHWHIAVDANMPRRDAERMDEERR